MRKRLKNDCFALPRGVNWTPVSDALAHLKNSLSAVVGTERVSLDQASGRIMAEAVKAPRSHPPYANSAVDGYAFAHEVGTGTFDLAEGRAAAGAPYGSAVEKGSAVRILTGARVPEGADTVVLEEDVELRGTQVKFEEGLKKGSNIRAEGEDVSAGQTILDAGRVLTTGDVAMAASVGVAEMPVRKRLRVGVLSTGSEIVEVGHDALPHQIFDANRPMLKGLLPLWGVEVIDLGGVSDDRTEVVTALDRGAANADVIVTSGGASAGDEDHISASLKESGQLETWRIALKPGRPLAMGMWSGVPVFGLPGNPVAAFVCTLLFVRPSLMLLGGSEWEEPEGFLLTANFEKRKKPGREEYLRARRKGDEVEVFASEGSGRVSGLSWADGLVALEHARGPVVHGEPVRFIPFSEFGL